MAKCSVELDGDHVLADALCQLIGHQIPEAKAIAVSQPVRVSTGLSRENWLFSAQWQDTAGAHDIPMILRRDPAGSLLDTDRRHEYAVLRALHGTAVPVPFVRWEDIEGAWLGSPSLVMDIVAGRCDWHALTGDQPLETRLGLARKFLNLLVDIQAVDWSGRGMAAVLPDPGPVPALSELARWESELRRVQLEPMPELDLVAAWLRRRATAARRHVLVHGDFKPGNALLVGDHIEAMLDWETAHIGDPLEDLGWITNPARAGEHQIPGHWERAQIVQNFKAATGYEFEDAELLWWNIFSCWKLSVIILTGLAAGVEGRFDRIYHSPTWLYRRMFAMMEG